MPKQESKEKILNKLHEFLDTFTTAIVCEIKDLPANNIHKIRKELRDIKSEVLCGKTTVIAKGIELYLERKKAPAKHHSVEELRKLSDLINHVQCMIIFTNQDIGKVTEVTGRYKVEKQAKVGNISPIEVTIKAGPTGLDSSMIELFQALKIQTKVIKNQLEVVSDSKVLVVGQKINISEINIMKKFNIKPYIHVVQIKHIYMGGKIYGPDILKINEEYLRSRLLAGISNVAQFSLAAGVPNQASAPHSILNGLTKLLGLKLHTGVDVPNLKGGVVVASASSAPAKEEAKPVEDKKDAKGGKGKDDGKKKKEPEPEPVDDDNDFGGGMGDLFG